jgi:hypothetical protein
VLTYPESRTFEPDGRCIYCGTDSDPGALQREHIIPYGLNGTLILPRASCPDCSKVTGALETFCLQHMFIDARTHLGLASRSHRRNKKPRPAPGSGFPGATMTNQLGRRSPWGNTPSR